MLKDWKKLEKLENNLEGLQKPENVKNLENREKLEGVRNLERHMTPKFTETLENV